MSIGNGVFIQIFAFVLALLSLPAFAGEVYKCKAADGSITFTNIKCPEKAAVQHYGSYQAAPDNPTQAYAAAQEADQIRSKRQDWTSPAEVLDSGVRDQRAIQSDLAALENEDPRTSIGSAARAARLRAEFTTGSKAEKKAAAAEYQRTMDALRVTVTGQPIASRPMVSAPAQPTRSQEPGPIRQPDKPPVYTTDCTQNGFSVHCNESDGSVSYGNVGPNGNGNVFGQDGEVTRIRTDPYGKTKTDSGVCVKNIYGQCQ